jgi:general L-amino acid transport system permease protein
MLETTADPRLVGARGAPKRALRLSWSNPLFRAIVWQVVIVGAVVLVAWYLIGNTNRNLAARHIATGFAFLHRVAGIPIGESPIAYNPALDTYGMALFIGILNTLRVAVVGIVLATLLGTMIGIGRLSGNWLLAKLTACYVETLRDIPLLLQLFFWYSILQTLPPPRQALHIGQLLYLSNRGARFEELEWDPAYTWGAFGLVLGLVCTIVWNRLARARQDATGRRPPVWPVAMSLMVGLPLMIWGLLGAPLHPDIPVLRGFNFQGGGAISPEYFALLLGLVIYTAAYIAEIVRSGIQAVPAGQWEAAGALGLRRGTVLRRIVLPQALRVIIPPMTSQYLNITKNSSLAVAIGFQDVVSIAYTTLNQTGQAIEGVAIIMVVYLTISLSISLFMNWYNARIALVER